MAHEGRWVPYLGGVPFLEHPPLFYVVLGTCIERFGATETVARLPSAVASALTLLLVFALGARLANPVAGLAGLLALVGMGGFFRYSHRALVDPLLMLCVMVGYYAYVRAVWGTWPRAGGGESGARVSVGWLGVVYLAAALAYYVKGFVGVVAIGGPLAVDALVGRRWRVVVSPAHLAGVPFLCAACAAWPLALYGAEGEAGVRAFLLHNGLYRIVPGSPDYLGGHEAPFWYYLTRLPDQVGWVALLVPATAAWLLRREAPSSWCLPALRFLSAVLPVGVLLLSLPGTKRGLYLLPFQPPLAVAIGAWVAAVGCSDAHRSRIERAVASRCARIARDDVSRAAAGACRGSYRILMIAFAISVACYVFVYPFANRDRNLEPMVREVSARVGTNPLVGLRLEEGIRGALAFYAGRIVPSVQDPQGLAQSFEPLGTGYVLAPVWMQEPIDAALGRSVAVAGTWRGAHNEFSLYALSPPQALAGPGARAE